MNQRAITALVVVLILVAAIGIAEKDKLTGMLVFHDSEPPKITITAVEVLDTNAKVQWSTSESAKSYFDIQGQKESYSESQKFGINLQGLSPSRKYDYTISACDQNNNCGSYYASFTTLAQKPVKKQEQPPAVTGFAISDLSGIQKSASTIIFILLAAIAIFIVVNAGYQRIEKTELVPASVRISFMLSKAEAMIEEKRFEEASDIYGNVRTVFDQLNSENKGKHQQRAMKIYSELLSHTKAKEANLLVDKYLEGNISQTELMRLRELLES